jgi:hypothetical protein
VARIIWSKPGNPATFVSDALGIERWWLRAALHRIKARSNLSGTDRVIIYDDGRVTDEGGEDVGNVYDEV